VSAVAVRTDAGAVSSARTRRRRRA
jgi:hypothetical protein